MRVDRESGQGLGKQEGLRPSLLQVGWGKLPPIGPQHGSQALLEKPYLPGLQSSRTTERSRPFYQNIDVPFCKEALSAVLTGSQVMLNVLC